jgi:hypothetical protein
MNKYSPSLSRLVMLAQGRPSLLALPLILYQDQEDLDDQQLAAGLGCSVDMLTRLALCERPRPAPHFREDVERIAHYIQADPMQLAMAIRAAESREALRQRAGAAQDRVQRTLLAARDNEEALNE